MKSTKFWMAGWIGFWVLSSPLIAAPTSISLSQSSSSSLLEKIPPPPSPRAPVQTIEAKSVHHKKERSVFDQRLSLDLKDADLRSVLSLLTRMTGVRIGLETTNAPDMPKAASCSVKKGGVLDMDVVMFQVHVSKSAMFPVTWQTSSPMTNEQNNNELWITPFVANHALSSNGNLIGRYYVLNGRGTSKVENVPLTFALMNDLNPVYASLEKEAQGSLMSELKLGAASGEMMSFSRGFKEEGIGNGEAKSDFIWHVTPTALSDGTFSMQVQVTYSDFKSTRLKQAEFETSVGKGESLFIGGVTIADQAIFLLVIPSVNQS